MQALLHRCLPCHLQAPSIISAVGIAFLLPDVTWDCSTLRTTRPLVLVGLIAVLPCACRGSGGNDNIEAYVSPAMLQDPWAGLMKQYEQPAAAEQPKPPVAEEVALSTPATAGQSMSDVFDAVEQVRHYFSPHCNCITRCPVAKCGAVLCKQASTKKSTILCANDEE